MESIHMNINDPASMTEEKIAAALKAFGDGATLRAMRGLSDEEMEAVYAMGVNFYTAGNYDDAEKVFKFLTLFDHLNSRYWTGYGSLRQVQRRFAEAIELYKFASFLDLENPKPMYYAAECHLALGEKEAARAALDALEQYAPTTTETGRAYRAKGAQLKLALAS